MKTFKQFLTETVHKFTPSPGKFVDDWLKTVAKQLGPGKYKLEADGYKTTEADFTFKATLKVMDDEGGFIITKGPRKFFRALGMEIRPSGSGRPNTISVKDIEEVRVTG
jgi:hypothetical protein